jgi:CheY-like chemotaxis protein
VNPSKVVLIIDDDPDIQESLGLFLESEGYMPERALNGHEALEYLNSGHPPSAILLDLMMPRMNGYELLEHLQETVGGFRVPIIVLSAAADADQVARRWGLRCVRKPFNLDVLSRVLADATAR